MYLTYLRTVDDLNILAQRRQTQKKIMQPKSYVFQMEEDLNFFENGKQSTFLEN